MGPFVNTSALAELLGADRERLDADRYAGGGLPAVMVDGLAYYDVHAVIERLESSPNWCAGLGLTWPVFVERSPSPHEDALEGAHSLLAAVVHDLKCLRRAASLSSLKMITRGLPILEAVAMTAKTTATYDVLIKRLLAAMAAMETGPRHE